MWSWSSCDRKIQRTSSGSTTEKTFSSHWSRPKRTLVSMITGSVPRITALWAPRNPPAGSAARVGISQVSVAIGSGGGGSSSGFIARSSARGHIHWNKTGLNHMMFYNATHGQELPSEAGPREASVLIDAAGPTRVRYQGPGARCGRRAVPGIGVVGHDGGGDREARWSRGGDRLFRLRFQEAGAARGRRLRGRRRRRSRSPRRATCLRETGGGQVRGTPRRRHRHGRRHPRADGEALAHRWRSGWERRRDRRLASAV